MKDMKGIILLAKYLSKNAVLSFKNNRGCIKIRDTFRATYDWLILFSS